MKLISIMVLTMVMINCSSSLKKSNTNIDLEKLIQRGKAINISDFTFNDTIDFTKIVELFNTNSLHKQGLIVSPIYFKNCTFKKAVYGHQNKGINTVSLVFENKVVFEDCYFEGEVNLRSSTFKNGIDFSGSVFKKPLNLEEVRCFNKALFIKSIFEAEVRMQNSFYYDHLIMKEMQAKDIFSMQNAVFVGDVNLGMAKCFGYSDFSRCRFDGALFLNYTEFHDRFLLTNSSLKDRVDFISTVLHQGILTGNVFNGKVRFIDVKGDVNYDNNSLLINPEVVNSPMIEHMDKS